MDKDKKYNLIMKNTRRLKQEVGTALSLKECKSIIEDSFNDGFEFKPLSELITENNTSKANLNITDVSNSEVVVGCHTCKHNPHKPYVPEICDKCNPENFSEWQQN